MILLYHKVFPEARTTWWVTPDAFYLQMLDIQNKKVVHLHDYDPSNPDHCVITFDGVYENVWKYAVPILRHFGYPFELFIVGDSVGRGNEFDTAEPFAKFADRDTLRKMIAAGGCLQWHTRSHASLLAPQSPEAYRHELTVPQDLRRLCPAGFEWFAYPHGEHDAALKAQAQERFQGALACDDGQPSDRFELPRVTVTQQSRFSTSTVSLIIPCYNYGRFAAEAIESALLQTYPPDEILFIDDASTDDSVEVARRYEPRIRVEANPRNLGVVANFSKAVSLTKGDYVCLLGADNRFRSDYVEKAKAALDADREVAIAYTHFALFGQKAAAEATATKSAPHPRVPGLFLTKFPAKPQRPIEEENYIHGSSMYRRTAYDQVGGYAATGLPEDQFLFARMLSAGWKARLVDEFLLEYRQHSVDQINQLKSLEITNVHLRRQIRAQQEVIAARDSQVTALDSQVTALDSQLMTLARYVSDIHQSRAWRLAMLFHRARLAVAPPGGFVSRLLGIFLGPRARSRRQREIEKHLVLLRSSHLFEEAWYLAHNPDVAGAPMDPALHYLLYGGLEGRDPSPGFSSKWYLHAYPDVVASGVNPLLHYLVSGRGEGRIAKSIEEASRR